MDQAQFSICPEINAGELMALPIPPFSAFHENSKDFLQKMQFVNMGIIIACKDL